MRNSRQKSDENRFGASSSNMNVLLYAAGKPLHIAAIRTIGSKGMTIETGNQMFQQGDMLEVEFWIFKGGRRSACRLTVEVVETNSGYVTVDFRSEPVTTNYAIQGLINKAKRQKSVAENRSEAAYQVASP